MSLVKTDEGKEALRSRDPQLSPRSRQIIILANGKLSRAAMGQLMGQDIQAEIELLVQRGYLAEGGTAAKSVGQTTAPTVVEIVSAFAGHVVANNSESPTPSSKAQVQPRQQSSSRRSLAGTKMYIMDMLQLLRNMDASAMAVSVHTSEGEMDFIYNVIVATRFIAQKSGLSYGMRVIEKLREIVPEAHLPAVDALALELELDADSVAM